VSGLEERPKTHHANSTYCALPVMNTNTLRTLTSTSDTKKRIPVTGCGGIDCCQIRRSSHFLDSRLKYGGEPSLMSRPRSNPRKLFASGTHFCYDFNKLQDLIRLKGLRKLIKCIYFMRSPIRDLPACSTVLQPTTLLHAFPRTVRYLLFIYLRRFQSASEVYRLSSRCLSTKVVPTFAGPSISVS
jgi:hypothetical protein